jgi:hypothetical protein
MPTRALRRDAEALRRELLAKASQLQDEAKVEMQAEQRRRKQTADRSEYTLNFLTGLT